MKSHDLIKTAKYSLCFKTLRERTDTTEQTYYVVHTFVNFIAIGVCLQRNERQRENTKIATRHNSMIRKKSSSTTRVFILIKQNKYRKNNYHFP